MTTTKTKATRRVFGRLKNVEAAGGLWTFELTKAGLVVHRRNQRRTKDAKIDFARLVNGGGVQREVRGAKVAFALTEQGLEVVRWGVKRTVPWEQLANMTNLQPELFA